MEQLTEDDFHELPLETIEKRTGREAPQDPTPEQEEEYRAKAWRSYQVDVENRDEWGTATQATPVPEGEEPEL